MKTLFLPSALLAICLATASAQDDALTRADKLATDQHWAEARAAYDEARQAEKDWRTPKTRHAVEGAVQCLLKLELWDDALSRMDDFLVHTRGSLEEAVGQRFLAGLYLSMPHQGTKQGGRFRRGQGGQGVYVYSWKKDRWAAVAHYERARDLVIWLRENFDPTTNPDSPERRAELEREQIGIDFDLAATLATGDDAFMGRQWGYWGWWWRGAFEGEEDSEAVEEADYEEPRFGRGWYPMADPEPPIGIPLGPDGQPQFVETPKAYGAQLGAGPKIRYLLSEVQQLDRSEKKEDAAKALFRSAMIARSLYGPEGAAQVPQPARDADAPPKKIWELGEDEALTIAGGRLRVVSLPPGESPIALLRTLEQRYPQSSLVPEARYARALYLQTRQQFPEAMAEYQALLKQFPAHERVASAKAQIALLQEAGVQLGAAGVYLPDEKPKLSFTHRNTATIQFKALHFDLATYVADRMSDKTRDYWDFQSFASNLFEKDAWKKYVRGDAGEWTEAVTRADGNRASEGSTLAPITAPGAYVVEASAGAGTEKSRVLVLVTDIAIVQKNAHDFGLIYLCDARTGQPLPEKALRIYEHWDTYDQPKQKNILHVEETTLTTDAEGVVKFKRKHSQNGSRVEATVNGKDQRLAFSFFQNFNEAQYVQGDYWENGGRTYVITDRPVYRPGSTVKYRIWVRQLVDRKYAPPASGQVNVEIWDARNNKVQSQTLPLDKTGAASGEFQLGDEPPLGVYTLRINGNMPDARHLAGGLFRVEEYKKPEFEVTVKPSATQARLGDKFKATIQARYYFGAPVAEAKVSYKVYRENYTHVYLGAGEYDWLYGKGYGRAHYAYPWFGWWGRWGCYVYDAAWWPGPLGWTRGWGGYGQDEEWASRAASGTRKALRDLVAQGTADLKPDGTYEVEVDTARAKAEQGTHDHRYTIEAEVRDSSRRTIEGKGSIIVTRQEFYAFVETDGGWYRPSTDARIEVRTLTPDNVPVAAKGEIIVARIRYGGANNQEVTEEEIKRWAAETDADGRLSFTLPIAGEGQWRIRFRSQDSKGEEVLGNAVFWAPGPKFDGRIYRFNDLELIADKRSYKVGETAHLLVNVAENNSHLLFSDNVTSGSLLSYRFIDLPQRSTVIDLPITENRVPNFFVEATLVRNGRVHTETSELFVPPVRGLLNVAVQSDKPVYRPGEKGKIRVEATDQAGKPAAGQVTLTAYDESVTYIQDEFGPSPRVFFHGQKRYHHAELSSSTEQLFQAQGRLRQPQLELYSGPQPEAWAGTWNVVSDGLTLNGPRGDSDLAAYRANAWVTTRSTLGWDRGISRQGGLAFGAGGMAGGALDASSSMAAMPMSMSKAAGRPMAISQNAIDALLFNVAPPAEMVEPEIRSNFVDTAVWLPSIQLDEHGQAEAEITFPQSLTTWRLHGYAITAGTQVGDAIAKTTTSKNLIVRLQAPRFFVERDEVVLSANVNNYLATEQAVKAELIVPAALFAFTGATDKTPVPDADGFLHLLAAAQVPAKGEHRFDWPVKVLTPGLAKITVKALTSEESDGMRLAFPVLVHGVSKTLAQSGSYRVEHEGERVLQLDLPAEIDPEQTKLELTFSPSLAGVMTDALPYLAGYPYGCVEQTMSRFYPSVLVRDSLKKVGLNLEAVEKQRKQMNAADLQHRYTESPVFDSAELERMIRAGLDRIYAFQRNDGGWGWWREDDSSPFQTAYVLQGLHAARGAGVNVDSGVYDRGFQFLQYSIAKELAKPKDDRQIGDLSTQAYLAYVLSLEHRFTGEVQQKWLNALYDARGDLSNYGRAQLALALHQEKKDDQARTLLRNLLQFAERDDSNETAWIRTPQQGWWYWWNNDIETNAWALRAIVALDPKSDLAPRLVKWLLNNRRHGYYWRSTRDTAQVIAAMTDYMQASGEAAPDYTLTVKLDDVPVKEVKVSKENLFTFDNRILLHGLQVKPGPHRVTISKTGQGALYYSSYLTYFTKEEDVKGAGNEIFVERQYFKLVPRTETVNLPGLGAAKTLPGNQPVALSETGRTEKRNGFTRVLLKNGDSVKSGDQIEAVLKITAKNTYDYLSFEDMKPAGCEPVELRSGGRWAGGLCANLELRDEKVVFFIGLLEQGEHILRYKLRAETPGLFHALPTSASAMYAPEIRAISDEMRLGIEEK